VLDRRIDIFPKHREFSFFYRPKLPKHNPHCPEEDLSGKAQQGVSGKTCFGNNDFDFSSLFSHQPAVKRFDTL
jgi:hypothetical protein